ncbi:MAG: DOMON-like domain-containing protein [Pseudomonadota bacterium]|nr:DOMON-like domain-containing protein [Pseudomonadota bacterium]
MTSHIVALIPHPHTPSPAVRGIEVCVHRLSSGELALAYSVDADLDRLRVPLLTFPRRAERLWEHTCFEAFIGMQSEPAYYELNFAPSGEWAVYAFRAYRDDATPAPDGAVLDIATHRKDHQLELDAIVHPEGLKALAPGAQLRMALAAVIEDVRGSRSYWALRHPPGKPDFHHHEAFALELEP